jgi:putative ABC transport system substrate-binding protein
LPRIGVLANTIPIAELEAGTSQHPAVGLLLEGLRERGWVPGKNVEMAWRSAEGEYARQPQQARELAASCDVIVVYGPGLDAAMVATSRVPIVMATSGVAGPVTDAAGIVRIESLAKPGGNVTGLSLSSANELNGKRLELLKTAAPHVRRVAILGHNLNHAGGHIGPITRAAAQRLGIVVAAHAFGSTLEKLEPAFAEMVREGVDAVIVTDLPATNLLPVQREIHRLAQRHRIPVMHEVLSAADSGGLMAYGHDIEKLYRRAGYYIDRILRGTKPGDIPIEGPAEFELRLNLRAAKAIGMTLPQSLLVQARRVIE